ncbi:UDP-glucuronosyl/UDP-glucosyltransferase [Dillenia turbinata]|uniref:Glycosyltransferase n=1 Tax=Dillenia turbinata TaxID=194707 RepID=A0AAN8VGZ3_9MAGN
MASSPSSSSAEILVVPFIGQGHLFPSMELCKHLASRNYQITLVIESHLSSTVPSSFRQLPLVSVAEISSSPMLPPPPLSSSAVDLFDVMKHFHQVLEEFLSGRAKPVCAVIDVMMGWSKDVFAKFQIPTVSFFTSGACCSALEYGAWKCNAAELNPGETRIIPGLPEEIALTYSDLQRKPHWPHVGGLPPGAPGGPFPGPPPGVGFPNHPGGGPPSGPPTGPGCPNQPGGGSRRFGPAVPGQQPPWLQEIEGAIAILLNTCDELEGPFIEYVAHKIGVPVWGVGPLLPDEYWNSAGSLIHDGKVRTNRKSNHSEEEIIDWLDSKPHGSVIYVSFGSELSPTPEECAELASALESTTRPFIWVIQRNTGRGPPPGLLGKKLCSEEPDDGYYPHGLDAKVGSRGLIIHGWAPQLLILSHPSTGGFLSHCGWNSTVEAIGRGVPILAWPIRGDQFFNAKLLISHLKIGSMVTAKDLSQTIRKDDILRGIERFIRDEKIKRRARSLKEKFECGFPASSLASLDAFGDFIKPKAA